MDYELLNEILDNDYHEIDSESRYIESEERASKNYWNSVIEW